jgi:para-nitrobenzyl esterase
VLADWTNHTGGSAWVYRFTRLRPGPGGEALGAYHGAELPYVFDTHDAWLPTTAADRMLTESVSGYWRNFAAAGDPNGPGLPYWPPYADGGKSVLELGASIRTVAPDLPALCTLVGPRVARW